MKIERRSACLILAACSLWALDLLVRHPLTSKFSFIHIVFIESLVGLITVLPWIVTEGITALQKMKKNDWPMALFLGGFGMTVAGFLSTESILEASPGTFSFLQIFQPLFVVYAASIFLQEKISKRYYTWAVWVVLSALLMYSTDLTLLAQSDLTSVPGAALIALATMLIWGLCTIAGKKLLKGHSPLTVIVLRWIFAFIFSAFFLAFDKNPIEVNKLMDLDVLWRFIFFGVVSGTGSMYLYYKGMKNLPAAKISFLELSFPALGMFFSALYTYEELTLLQGLGLASFFLFFGFHFGGFKRPVAA